jgi:glc operon protein GlcG
MRLRTALSLDRTLAAFRSAARVAVGCAALAGLAGAAPALAQLGSKPALNLATAKQLAVAAQSEATKNGWTVVIALVDDGGHLLYLERMDQTQHGSVEVATAKAQTAVAFKRPTKALEDAVSGGRNVLLRLPATPIEGGLPLSASGVIVGAIGVSGATSQQDGVVAQAAVDALAALLAQGSAGGK